MLSVSDVLSTYLVWKPFLFLYQYYWLKCRLHFLGKFDIQKCLFTVSQNVLFHGIKILEREKNAIGNVEQIILSFQPGYIRKKEITSKSEWRALVFLSYFEKISTFFWNSSILSVQHFPYETLWECSVLAQTPSSYLTELADSNYTLKMNYEVFSLFVCSHWCFF